MIYCSREIAGSVQGETDSNFDAIASPLLDDSGILPVAVSAAIP
ncbi:hypothetical protein [Laspinema palackyanum]